MALLGVLAGVTLLGVVTAATAAEPGSGRRLGTVHSSRVATPAAGFSARMRGRISDGAL